MPTPVEFPNKESLISRLRADERSLARFFERRYQKLRPIVRDSVGSNTFRAFAHMLQPPAQVFYSWANQRLSDDGVIRQITDLRSEEEYDRWLKDFSNDFSATWDQRMGPEKRMTYGPGRKLPNLLMKHVVLWSRLDDVQRSRLIRFLHIPFDKYSLSILRNCIPNRFRPVVGRIRKDVTMKFVGSEAKYNALMVLSREIAEEADIPPIYLDVLAWNQSHA